MNNTDNGRPDMQLARDRALGTIASNIRNRQLDREILKDALMNEWATCGNGIPLSEIIKMLCVRGGGIRRITKSDVYPDCSIDEIIDAIAMAADTIPEGWDEPIVSQEQIQVDLNRTGGVIEITVRLINNEVD